MDSDALTDRAQTIQEEVEVFRLLGQGGGVPRPLPVALVVEPDTMRPMIVYAFQRFLANNGLRPFVRVVDKQPTSWVARVLENRLRVEQPSDAGSLNNWVPSYSTSQPPVHIVADILVSLGILISALGASSDAVRLFRAAGAEAVILDEPSTAARFVETAVREGAADLILLKVLELLPRLEEPFAQDVFDGYLLGLLDVAPNLTSRQVKSLRKAAKQGIGKVEDAGHQKNAARLANNVAQLMRNAGAWNRVEEFLDLCARLDPAAYGARKDVLGLRGDTRWHLNDYTGALAAYSSARDSGLSRTEVVPPLSDTLFELGRYREAADLIDEWWDSEQEIDARSVLRRIILEEVMSDLGLETQDRHPGPDLANDLNADDDDAVKQAQIQFDALDLNLWSLRSNGDRPLIGRFALLAFRLGHPQAWIVTIMLARFGGMEEKLVSILTGGAIEAIELVESVNEMRGYGDSEEFVAFLDELVEKALDYSYISTAGSKLNVVDSDNQVLLTLTFDTDGFPLGIEGNDLLDRDREESVEANVDGDAS